MGMRHVGRAVVVGAAMCAASLAASGARAQLSSAEILERLQRQDSAARAGVAASQSDARGISVTYGGDAATGAAEGAEAAPAARPETPEAVRAALPAELPPEMPQDAQVNLRITFETNSAFIRDGQAGALAALCDALSDAPRDWAFNVIGHADAAGDDLYNLRLSEARAREVRRYLSRECGVSADRLRIFGLGETRPLQGVPRVSEENRRVEIQIGRDS